MKKVKSLLFVLALAAGILTSCKDKETTTDETTMETTTEMPADTMSISATPAEMMPADTTAATMDEKPMK